MKAFELQATLSLDTSDYEQALRKASGSAEDLAGAADDVTASGSSMMSVFKGNLLSDFFQQAASAALDLAKESIGLASDLKEVQNVVDTTFGSNADQVESWAEKAKTSFGLSELSAKRYASTMGAMLKSMGLADAEVVNMSTDMAGLAADMASFYNLDTAEAFEKIRAGISGETEPLKQLGINMTETNLAAFAMAEGFEKAYDEMTSAEKAMVRYQYLLDATSDAQGDFAKTSDSYANAVRLFEENINSVKTNLGDALLGMVEGAINTVNNWFETDYQSQLNDVEAAYNQRTAEAQAEYNLVTAALADSEERLKQAEAEEAALAEETAQEEEGKTWEEATPEDAEEALASAAYATEEMERTFQILKNVWPEFTEDAWDYNKSIEANISALKAYAAAERQVELYRAAEDRAGTYQSMADEAYAAYENAVVDQQITAWEIDNEQKVLANQRKRAREIALAYGAQELIDLTSSDDFTADDLAGWQSVDGMQEVIDYMLTAEEALGSLEQEQQSYNDTVATTAQNYEDATKAAEVAREAMAQTPGALQAAYEDALGAQQTALDSLQDALTELGTYRKNVLADFRSDLEKTTALTSEPMVLQIEEDFAGGWDTLTSNVIGSTNSMVAFQHALEELQGMGMDAGALSEMSEYNADNYQWMMSLVNAPNAQETVAAFNEDYQALQTARESLAQTQTDLTLENDDEYQEMVEQVDGLVTAYEQAQVDTAEALAAMSASFATEADSMTLTMISLQNSIISSVNAINLALSSLSLGGITAWSPGASGVISGVSGVGSHADGLGYVPYDNYLTYLHRGEQVLNRADADSYRRNALSASVDYDRLGTAVATALTGAAVQMDGVTVGTLVAGTVSRQIEMKAQAGRYA